MGAKSAGMAARPDREASKDLLEFSARDKEKIRRSSTPSLDGFRPYQAWRAAFGSVAHMKGIAIRQVRRNIARISHRNIGAFFPQLDVVPVVFESMRQQTGSASFAARYGRKQHGDPPGA